MHPTTTKREEDKIKELARQYTAKGYRVVMEPSRSELPEFMRSLGYLPDLIAYGEKGNLVVEVKTSQTVSSAQGFSRFIDLVGQQEGWDFVLVMTNPKSRPTRGQRSDALSAHQALEQLTQAENVLEAGPQGSFNNAALLVAWAGFEAAVRLSLSQLYDKDRMATLPTLVRDGVMYGVITRKDGEFIEKLMQLRNSVAHGFASKTVAQKDLKRLIGIGKRVLSETIDEMAPNKRLQSGPR
jgi:hypothetical protein